MQLLFLANSWRFLAFIANFSKFRTFDMLDISTIVEKLCIAESSGSLGHLKCAGIHPEPLTDSVGER
jgi:hypothetical protein